MKSTKWMRSVLLAVALTAVAGVMAVLACGSASPVQQSAGGGEKEKPTKTPTATLHPDCVVLTLPDGGKGTSCPSPGPENVEANLRRHYNGHMLYKASAARDGRRSVVDPVYIGISVKVTTHDSVIRWIRTRSPRVKVAQL